MERADVEIVIVDLNVLYCDIDLTPSKKIKTLLTFGSNNKLFVRANCESFKLEDGIDFDEEVTVGEWKRIDDFEEQANKMQIVTMSQTSGSTG